MPPVGDDDILVKVEGCGVCGTDAHEFKRDPFNLIPVALGHEGTGEIVKMGKNVKKDSAGKDLHIGDKVVTCMIFKDDPDITMYDLNKQNVGGADVYGLLPDDDIHLNGWFSDYILIRKGSTVFNVSDLDLTSRILIEPCAGAGARGRAREDDGDSAFQHAGCRSGLRPHRPDLYRRAPHDGNRNHHRG